MSETQPLLSSKDDRPEYESLREENKPQMVKACSLHAVLSDSDQDAIRRLSYAMGFAFIFMAVEMVGGYIANSIAILSDGAHLLSDVASYLISIYAIYASSKPANADYSWGYKRSEIMGAIASVLMIWAITGWLVVEAIQRFFTPSDVNGGLMLTVAVLGVIVNGSMGLILTMKGHGHSHGLGGGTCGGHGSNQHGAENDHGHSHASNDQGCAENNHGHSHASNDQACTENDHGHSHASGPNDLGHIDTLDHGHSHAKVSDRENSATCCDHGHSDDAHSHAKANHGHSHATSDHGHSHADHAPYVEETVLNLSDDLQAAYEHVEVESLNLRAAYLHVLGDLLQSSGVVVSGFLIWMDPVTFWWADPVCTLVFAVIVVYTTYGIVRDVFEVMMMAVPKHININDMRKSIYNCDINITQVHCLHVWALSPSVVAMTCTIDVEDRVNSKSICSESVLIKVKEMVRTKFGISHSSIEVRNPDHCMNSPRPENCVRRDNSTSDLANISI